MDILEGKGTAAHNAVVITNAAVALTKINKRKSLVECIPMAEDSLMSGRALKTLKKLLELE
jgi:anthranilate phosphoribosyltransferase